MIYFTFGRFNPPTIGHLKLLDQLKDKQHIVFLSHTQDKKRNPLSWDEKLYFCELMFPNIIFSKNKDIKDPFQAVKFLIQQNYTNIRMIVGSDRIKPFNTMFNNYINKPDSNDPLMLNSFDIISAGDRNSNDNIEGVSASKVRALIKEKKSIKEYCPTLSIANEKKLRQILFDRLI